MTDTSNAPGFYELAQVWGGRSKKTSWAVQWFDTYRGSLSHRQGGPSKSWSFERKEDAESLLDHLQTRPTPQQAAKVLGLGRGKAKRVRQVLGLMNSMIYGGESHSKASEEFFKEARGILLATERAIAEQESET